MKTKLELKLITGLASSLMLALSLHAGSITNNFTVSYDYVANGILGDTNWDGVYLGFGDVPNGNNAGNGNGVSIAANANSSFPGFLTVQTTASDWSAAGDDGFYIWKLVSGDFDVSVQSAPVWNNTAFNFAGLLVRAWNTNRSGAPVSFTSATPSENWLMNWRFQEFGINELREATNGANIENTFPDSNADTSTPRYFRITRTGDVFTFYWKTNQTDPWVLINNASAGGGYVPASGTITRPDWNGMPVQVGIAQAIFGANQPQAYFQDFELSGPNVNPTPAGPAAPANIVASLVNSNSVALSWTTNGGDGSLVVLRGRLGSVAPLINVNPINGLTYPSSLSYQPAYTPTNTWLAGGEQVIYAGSATNITITGLAGSNNIYSVAVFSYSGSGAATVYNTASPATNSFAGPGTLSSVSFTVSPLNLPIGGAGLATIIASYTSGDSYNVSSDPSASLTSSDPTVIQINNGAMTALTNGSVQIVASFGGFNATNSVSVQAPVFTDNFANAQDYIANGLAGTPYDGLFLNFGDVPGANKGNDAAAGATSQFLAETNVLTIEAAGSTWAVAGNDGPFLFKVVTGDFQAYVHVASMNTINNNDVGIMARLFNNTGTASQGGGGGTGGAETHINWVKVQNGTPAARRTIDSGGTTIVNGLAAADGWLLMQRVNSTNFLFYEKANQTDPWNPVPTATMVLAEASNSAPMEVGIEQEMRTASDGIARLDALMIDGPGITPPATPPPAATNFTVTLNGDLSMTFNWVAASASGTPIRSMLVMRAAAPVTAAPTLAQAGQIGGTGSPVNFGSGVDLGGGNWMVFATGNPAASTNVSCTVAGLTPGTVYYAVVYTFVGSGGNKSFNTVVPPTGASANLQDGALLGVSTLPLPSIPLGGVEVLQVIGLFQGGAQVNVSPFATITVADPTVIGVANGVLTGLKLGSTAVSAVYSGFTNSFTAVVRPPTFADNFTVSHDYVANRTTGSAWDGVYLNYGDVPESTYVASPGGLTSWCDANISSNGVLTVTNNGGGWENDDNDGFFLFKYVPGDFQMAIHITDYDIVNYTFPGIGARAYTVGTNGTDIGSPFDPGEGTNGTANGECWVNFTRFDEFGIGTYARLNLDNGVLQSTQGNPNNGDNWLLITRTQGTNFNFYERATNTAPWHLTPNKTSYQVPRFAGVPMQVGPQWMTFSGNTAGAQFDSFMLDAAPPVLQYSRVGNNLVLTYGAIPGTVLQSTTNLQPSNWQPASGTFTATNSVYEVTVPLNNAASFYRLKR